MFIIIILEFCRRRQLVYIKFKKSATLKLNYKIDRVTCDRVKRVFLIK